jgi:hypothetical protein
MNNTSLLADVLFIVLFAHLYWSGVDLVVSVCR